MGMIDGYTMSKMFFEKKDMKPKVDFSSVRTVRVHKEQFEAIEKKAKTVIITCKEDGKCIAFERCNTEDFDCDVLL